VLVVNFWATWCPPCRREIPDFIAAQDAYADQGVQFIGVALDDAKSTVQQYAEEHGINYPNIFEGGREMTGQFGGVRAIPTTFIIGRDGQILDRHVGGMTRADLDEAIQAAL